MIGAFWPIILRDDWRFFFRDQYYVSITFLAVLDASLDPPFSVQNALDAEFKIHYEVEGPCA